VNGLSKKWLQNHHISSQTKVIDMSRDFRLKYDNQSGDRDFVYGLPEVNKTLIKKAHNIANPGCFATAIQLGLLPLAAAHRLQHSIHIHGITGATGAGNQFAETTHFSWRSNNISVYKPFEHQHLDEITESLTRLQSGFSQELNFIPVRGDFTRGIFVSMYTDGVLSHQELTSLYQEFYSDMPFTKVSDQPLHLKQVVNTNYALIHVEKIDHKSFITVVIDNLLKGAAGQAIENMNLMFGLKQTEGLKFKASYF
jgi:N-acetyl-gamma-glutamyl-phosphate reductase